MRVYLLMLVVFLASVPGSASSLGQKTESENDIREIVLLYMFEHEAQQQKPYTKVLFISVQKKDPDDKFIARFKDHIPPVKKVSESVITGDMGGVVDRRTREVGMLYSLGEIKWINENEVDIDGSYHVAKLFAGSCRYRLVRDRDKWIVKGCGETTWRA